MDNEYYTISARAEKEVSYRFIARIIGLLLVFESLLLMTCCCVSLFYGEDDLMAFCTSFGISLAAGVALMAGGHMKAVRPCRSEAYIIVALSWVFFTIFGMMPYLTGGYIPSVTDAFFETMSGFTTTGATILDDIERLPHGILFWRSLTQWIGGLGIVCFTIVLLPGFGTSSQMLYMSESTGVIHDKICSNTRVMARLIWMVYFLLTAMETCLLMWGGMGLFDAVCHSMATTATGGFSTKQDSIAYWHSPYIEYVVAMFMLLSAVNFSLYILAVRGRWRQAATITELKWFLTSVTVLTVIIAATLVASGGYAPEKAFRKSLPHLVRLCHRRLQPVAIVHMDAPDIRHGIGRLHGFYQRRREEPEACDYRKVHKEPVSADTPPAGCTARKSRKIDWRQTGDHGVGVFCGLHDCGICRLDTAHGKWSGADRSHEYSHLGNGQCGPGPGLFRSRLFLVSPS